MNPRRHRRVAWWVLLGLLFAQVALAAHACPRVVPLGSQATSAADMPEECGAAGSGLPSGPSALCLEHCKSGQRLLDTQPTFDPLQLATLTLAIVAVIVVPSVVDDPPSPLGVAQANGPPPLALSRRLRI